MDIIAQLETELNSRVDARLRVEIEKNSKFEILNNQKITPHFVWLSRSTLDSASISGVRKSDGSNFQSEAEQVEYTVQHFETIYKKDSNLNANFNGCVEGFLGPTICSNPIVVNSKIPLD
jgi:hypothetical protein